MRAHVLADELESDSLCVVRDFRFDFSVLAISLHRGAVRAIEDVFHAQVDTQLRFW